jgi:hypothetical protein
MNGIAFHVEGIYEKGIPTPTAPQYSILPEVIPSHDPRLEKQCFVNNIQATELHSWGCISI